jgi:Flp pilus assembly protein TadD
LRDGDLTGAAADLQAAVDREPEQFWPHYYRGACAVKAGDFTRAVAAFDVCVALAPREWRCYYHRALASEAAGDVGRALADYDRAVALAPGSAEALLNRGLLRHRSRDYAGAMADLSLARSAGVDPVLAEFNLAIVCRDAGDPIAAREHVARLLELQPTHAAGLGLRERLADPVRPEEVAR